MIHRLVFIASFFAVVIIYAVFYFFYLLFRGHKKWKEAIRNNPADRMSESKKNFIDFYLTLGYEEDSIDFVYSHTQSFLRAKDLTLLHTDHIVKLYERGEGEWFRILNKWLKELGHHALSEADFKARHSGALNFEFLIKVIQAGQAKQEALKSQSL
jgi:hypothetical protein